jgi:uncharacterized protein YuzE
MKGRYLEATVTRYIEPRDGAVSFTQDLDQNTLLDVDRQGMTVAVSIVYFKKRAESAGLLYERVEA